MGGIINALTGGLQAGERMRALQEERDRQAQQQQLIQGLGQNFNPQDLAQLAVINPQAANILQNMNAQQIQQQQQQLSGIVRQAKGMLDRNDMLGLVNLAEKSAGIFPDSANQLMNAAATGDLNAISNLINNAGASLGIDFEAEQLKRREKEAEVALKEAKAESFDRPTLPDVQSSKILDDGSVIQVMKRGDTRVIAPDGTQLSGRAATDHIRSVNKTKIDRQKDLSQFKFDLDKQKLEAEKLSGQQKEIAKTNIKRIGDLSQGTNSRIDAIKKATKFKTALESGEATSGARRRGFQFVPGVFTTQGEFDEEFNAFAEVAARQQLKAAGETRPTDADVEGMKRAMFGVGRDPQVNIELLNNFINNQRQEQSELESLMEANKAGNLGDFIFRKDLPNSDQRAPVTRKKTSIGRFQIEEVQ